MPTPAAALAPFDPDSFTTLTAIPPTLAVTPVSSLASTIISPPASITAAWEIDASVSVSSSLKEKAPAILIAPADLGAFSDVAALPLVVEATAAATVPDQIEPVVFALTNISPSTSILVTAPEDTGESTVESSLPITALALRLILLTATLTPKPILSLLATPPAQLIWVPKLPA